MALKSPCNPHEGRFKVLKLSETWSNMRHEISLKPGNLLKLLQENALLQHPQENRPGSQQNVHKQGVRSRLQSKLRIREASDRETGHSLPEVHIEKVCAQNFFDYEWEFLWLGLLYQDQELQRLPEVNIGQKPEIWVFLKRIISPDFKKQLPREADNNTKLPGFMQVY